MPSFLASAQGLPAGVTLREESPADREFLADLYASTRADELRPVAWDDDQKRTFLRGQFELQWTHYRQHYPGAEWLVIQGEGGATGRLYADTGPREVRLMDVALRAEHRNRGIGTAIVTSLLRHADRLGLPVTLHVEPFNPALRIYDRLGFATRETRGIYLFMERPPG
ncbi:MAG: GNAT family N-acetyltransferase [Casimicrobiaceae bacterium]